MLVERHQLLRLGPGHHAPRAVRAAVKALGIAQPAHDEALRPHRSGDDAHRALRGSHRPFTGDEYVFAKVVFPRHIVVMAVHRFAFGLERLGDLAAQRVEHMRHHHAPVKRRKVLRPFDRFDIIVEMVRPFREIGEVLIRQVDMPLAHVLLGQFNEKRADRVTHPARAGVEHDPHPLLGIEAQLDEVVAGSQRPQMHEVVRVLEPRILGDDLSEAFGELCPGIDHGPRRIAPRTLVALAAPDIPAMRHRRLDRGANTGKVVRQVACDERSTRGHHAAANVDADRSRDHRAFSRDHRSDGRADPHMHVGHGRNMLEDERHLRRLGQLLTRLVVNGDTAGPHLDRRPAFHVLIFIRRLGHRDLLIHRHKCWRQVLARHPLQSCRLLRGGIEPLGLSAFTDVVPTGIRQR